MSLTTVHDIGVALQAYLAANGCPIPVIDGPEQARTAWTPERVVLEHDTTARSSFDSPRGLHTNAKHLYTSLDPYKVTVYVQSRLGGAKTFEHRTRAHVAREAVIAGLRTISATNKNVFVLKDAGFITPPDLAASEQPNGAAVEVKFTYGLPVRVVTFVGDAQPEGTLTGLSSTTTVSRNADNPDASVETACGA